jgi:peroxiredoxin
MKQILLIFAIATLISCQEKRDSYLIKGTVTGIPDSTIIDLYVQYDNMGQRINSDTIINGYFEFTDTLDSRPSKMNLRMRDWNNYFGSCDLWVDHELIEITGSGKYLSAWVASGDNAELKALNRLHSQTRELSVITDSLYMLRMKNRKDKELSKSIRKSVDSIGQISRKIQFGLIEENPNSQSALEMLYNIAKFDTTISKKRIKTVYDNLDTIYQNTLYGEGILTIIEDKPIPNIGDKMVDFIAYDTEGEKHRLSEFEGKYILLDFWALACGPCIKAIPETRELYSNNKEILTVVGINMVTNEDSWRETSKKDSITWINLSDGKGTFAGISADYGINGFPTYILIDPQGVIIEKWMGYWPNVFKQKLENHIEGLNI